MSDKLFKVPIEWAKNSYINQSSYEAKYKQSIDNNEKFGRRGKANPLVQALYKN